MRCFGIIKFYDDKVNFFGVITDVETEAKESIEDVKFKGKNLISELDMNAKGQPVVFNLKQGLKKIADEVRILEDLETPEILSISQFLKNEKLFIVYRILSHRGYKFNDHQLTPLYQSILEEGINPQFNWDLWEISKNLKSIEQEIFFKFLDEAIFCDGFSRFRVENFNYLENSEVLDSYISRCIEVKSPSVYKLHQYLHERNQKEKAQRLIPIILEGNNFTKPIYYWEHIIDLHPNAEEFFNEVDLPSDFLQNYLLHIIGTAKHDESKLNKFLLGIHSLIRQNKAINDDLLARFIKIGLSVDDKTDWYFISNYWDRVLSIQSDYQITHELGTILNHYPKNITQLILHVIKSKKTLYPPLIEVLKSIRGKVEILSEIYQEIPDIHLKFPLFYINQMHENLKNHPKLDLLTFAIEFKKVFKGRIQNKITSEERVVFKYCINESLNLIDRGVLRSFFYDFFLSDINFFLLVREQLLGKERNTLISDNEEVINQFNTRWREDFEIKFLVAFIGISAHSNQAVDRPTLNLIFDTIDSALEIELVYYFTKKNLNETIVKENFRNFIVSHNFKSFSGILLKNLLLSEKPSEALVLNQLNKSFYEGFEIYGKERLVELKDYFRLDTLVRKCKGRTRFHSMDYEYSNNQSRISNPTPTFCEGKFWKFAGETKHFSNQPSDAEIYWCRGDHCAKPNRKSNLETDFSTYSLCEISDAYSAGYTDLLYATIAGWANRLDEILPRLKCRACNSILFPVPYVPKKLGYYATPLFNCLYGGCLEREAVIRITHCIKCHKLVDSRDAAKCSNGWLICHDSNCKGCCDEHKKKEIEPIYRQKR